MMNKLLHDLVATAILGLLPLTGHAAIPATPVMILYKFNGSLDVPS